MSRRTPPPSSTPTGKKRVSSCVRITTHITCRCTTKRSTPPRERSVCQDPRVSQYTLRAGAQHSVRRETRVRRRYFTDSYGWCADAHHYLRPRRCMDSNPELGMRCAGAHHLCRSRRCVDNNHRRVIRCAGAHHHPRPCRCRDSNFRLVIPLSSTPARRQ